MTERDMMYGGYYQNFPGNMAMPTTAIKCLLELC